MCGMDGYSGWANGGLGAQQVAAENNWLAAQQANAFYQGRDWNDVLLGAQAAAKPVDHKRKTRRKWWLVRQAIPLPWVRR